MHRPAISCICRTIRSKGLSDAEKVRLLERIDVEARRIDPRVTQVMASLSAAHEVVLVMASDGTVAADVRPLVRMNVSVIVQDGDDASRAMPAAAAATASRRFTENDRWREFVHEAVRSALVNLDAAPAPAGTMTVVLGPGWPGILLHEAIGHGLEGDFNRKGTSAFSGRIGEQVAAPEVHRRRRRHARLAPRLAQRRRRRHADAAARR